MPRKFIAKHVREKAIADWKAKRKTAKQLRAELKVTSKLLQTWGIDEERETAMDDTQPELAPATEQQTLALVAAVGSDGRRRMKQEIKDRAVAEYLKGERPAKEIGAEIGVSDATIYAWVKQQKKREQADGQERQPRAGTIAPLTMAAAGRDASAFMLGKARKRICKVTCPCGCGHTFYIKPPSMTETLVLMAAHLADGEEP
jgi:transposase-like protein